MVSRILELYCRSVEDKLVLREEEVLIFFVYSRTIPKSRCAFTRNKNDK